MKESFYFPHDYNARNDEKIIKLMQERTAEAYAFYWMIVEMLYEAKGYLSLDYDCVAFALRTKTETIKAIINDYGLFFVEENKNRFTSRRVLENFKLRKDKSQKARKSAQQRWVTKNANALPTHSECYAIKERKGKERKVYITEPKVSVVCGSKKQTPATNGVVIKEIIEHFCKESGIPLDSLVGDDWARLTKSTKKLLERTKDIGDIKKAISWQQSESEIGGYPFRLETVNKKWFDYKKAFSSFESKPLTREDRDEIAKVLSE